MAKPKNMETRNRQKGNEEKSSRFKIFAPEPQIDSPYYHQDLLDMKFNGKGTECLLQPNNEVLIQG